jgi:hypothetical protein
VAITLVELGLALPGVATALNVERGMALLRRKIDEVGSDADSTTRVRHHCASEHDIVLARQTVRKLTQQLGASPWSIRPRWSPRRASWRATRSFTATEATLSWEILERDAASGTETSGSLTKVRGFRTWTWR